MLCSRFFIKERRIILENTPQPKKRSLKWLPWVIIAAVVWELWTSVICAVCLCVSMLTALGVSEIAAEPVPELTDTEAAFSQTLDNGDFFYSPEYSHAVQDQDYTVLYYDNLLLVFTTEDLSEEDQADLADWVNGEVVGVVSGGVHALQLLVPESDLASLQDQCSQLMDDSRVLYACPEYPVQILRNGDGLFDVETYETELWWQDAIGAPQAWNYLDLCQDIKVGIVDAGFYEEHEDLEDRITYISTPEYNTADDHGTHVAGIIGAQHNGIGIQGIAPHAELYCADVWPDYTVESYHTVTELLAVINAMAQEDVRVVNHSWGALVPCKSTYLANRYGPNPFAWLTDGDGYETYMQQRLDKELVPTAEACLVMMSQLIHSGYEDLIMVQAAGNGYDMITKGCSASLNGFFSRIDRQLYEDLDPRLLDTLTQWGITYEQIDDRIMIVGAVEEDWDAQGNYYLTEFSSFGTQVDICAPGGSILSCVDPEWGGYEYFDGTSMAAPMVTGSVAYIWSMDPTLTAGEVKALLLENTETNAVGVGDDEGTLYPMLNVGRAVRYILENRDIVTKP